MKLMNHTASSTVENLLNHTSGIVSFTGKPGYLEHMSEDMTPAALIDGGRIVADGDKDQVIEALKQGRIGGTGGRS